MTSDLTVHAGEYLVGAHLEQHDPDWREESFRADILWTSVV